MEFIMNKLNTISRRTVDALNSPINLTEIAHSIFCNVKSLLIGETPMDINELYKNQKLISDEELGFPANGVFSSQFSEILREALDKNG
jgi:hypothetical protein